MVTKKAMTEAIRKLHTATSFEEIMQWFDNNGDCYLKLTDSSNKKIDIFNVKITYLDLNYDNVSNGHSCPANGVTNWSRDPSKPLHYPGWHGRIEFRYSHELSVFSWNAMKKLAVHTGTGGGTSNGRYGFEVRFFDDDWPNLSRLVTFELVKNPKASFIFKYGAPYYFRH